MNWDGSAGGGVTEKTPYQAVSVDVGRGIPEARVLGELAHGRTAALGDVEQFHRGPRGARAVEGAGERQEDAGRYLQRMGGGEGRRASS